ncbi:hypothetical protein U8P80_08695 [Rhizobium beringeri]|nr:hypothetical protein U8P80_08695 [Rhizobium beringeri]WSH16736.1 hypothetical protein U8P74_08695 [Rhizobium beringeri]
MEIVALQRPPLILQRLHRIEDFDVDFSHGEFHAQLAQARNGRFGQSVVGRLFTDIELLRLHGFLRSRMLNGKVGMPDVYLV